MQDNLNEIELRSEEVQEILSDVPNWMIRWGNSLLLLVIFFLLMMSWLVTYPDVIQAKAILTTANPAQKVYARTRGRIDSIFVNPNDQVSEGSTLALLENTAKYQDVVTLKNALNRIDISSSEVYFPLDELPILFLGEIEQAFAVFENNYIAYTINNNYKPYSNEANGVQLKIGELNLQMQNLNSQVEINKRELDFKEIDLQRSKTLFSKGVIAKRDFEEKQIELLQAQRNYENLIGLRSQLREAINIAQMEKRSVDINYTRENITLYKNLVQSLNQLKKSIKDWEYKYILKSEESGNVSFMNYWNTNQTVDQGEIIFTILPLKNKKYIAKLNAPSQNSGKIQTGQVVNISLMNYPQAEFGVLKGKVSSVSKINVEDKGYIVDVKLPDSLYTSYGFAIDYKPEMSASAEIITEDLRLLDRFFIQFKQLVNR